MACEFPVAVKSYKLMLTAIYCLLYFTLLTLPNVYQRMDWAILSLPPSAQHHRTLDGTPTYLPPRWRQEVELAWLSGYIPSWNARPKTVTDDPSQY